MSGMSHRALALALAGTLVSTAAAAQTISLATDRAGTTYNAVGAGMAKVITEGSNVRVIVRPYAGPDAYMEQLDAGEVQIATQSGSSAYVSYQGDNRQKKAYKNIRLLRAGDGGLYLGFIVLKDSGIKTVADLKGKRVASDFGGHAVISRSIAGGLATAGLAWKDVNPVPVPGALDGPAALDAGRVDASWASLGQPIVREIHAKKGVRYLGFEYSPKNVATLKDMIYPGVSLAPVKANPDVGVESDIHMIAYDALLIGHKDVDAATVKAVLTALWEKTDELVKIHRGLSGFTHDAAVTTSPAVPYHPAAIEFYKSKNLWTADAEAGNKKVMN
ncbi:MAG: TAXI family TRAP transporter solute-binding subunit [Rhodospirillaceae bacterium]